MVAIRGEPIPWLGVYRRWLRHRADVIDTIYFADVHRMAGELSAFSEVVGPLVCIRLGEW